MAAPRGRKGRGKAATAAAAAAAVEPAESEEPQAAAKAEEAQPVKPAPRSRRGRQHAAKEEAEEAPEEQPGAQGVLDANANACPTAMKHALCALRCSHFIPLLLLPLGAEPEPEAPAEKAAAAKPAARARTKRQQAEQEAAAAAEGDAAEEPAGGVAGACGGCQVSGQPFKQYGAFAAGLAAPDCLEVCMLMLQCAFAPLAAAEPEPAPPAKPAGRSRRGGKKQQQEAPAEEAAGGRGTPGRVCWGLACVGCVVLYCSLLCLNTERSLLPACLCCRVRG